MKKKLLALLLALALCLSLGGTALAAGGFTDVPDKAWYLDYLSAAVDSGLINGRGNGTFAPEESITVAEAVKLAACIHQLFADGRITLENGTPWYASYLSYALENKLLVSEPDSGTLNAPISRGELMYMVCSAIPQAQRTEINDIPDGSIPDLFAGAYYRDNIYTLYRMGILTGSDDRGACLPDENIKRSEVAAIVVRTIDASKRVSFSLEEPATALDTIRTRAADNGDLCAVAFLGYTGMASAETWNEVFPFLADIPQARRITHTGDELYLIVPAGEDVTVRVYEYIFDWSSGNGPSQGQLLAESTGDPILLSCNVSDIVSNTILVLEAPDGRTLTYSPRISLKDGTLSVPDTGVYDFSQY